jgi:hypothetical protein
MIDYIPIVDSKGIAIDGCSGSGRLAWRKGSNRVEEFRLLGSFLKEEGATKGP